jgi:small GTP-binding protein
MAIAQLPSQERVKVVFIGDSGVGKSALFARFQNRAFNPVTQSTIGGACANVDVQTEGTGVMKLIVWDTAGQEAYRGIVPMYFTRCAFVLIVYDISSLESFESVLSWHKLSREKAPQVAKVILIANKCDLEKRRLVSIAAGNELAGNIRAFMFFETSAATGDGVEELLSSIATTALREKEGLSELIDPPGDLITRNYERDPKKPCC